jgi:hypothetical protein
MADLSGITAVRPTSNTLFRNVGYGATIAAGQSIYYSDSDSEYVLADCDVADNAAPASAIAITPGVNGGSGLIATGGSIILVGTTMTVGTVYIASDTAGGIKPISDAVSGDFITILGTASTSTQLDLAITATGNQVP